MRYALHYWCILLSSFVPLNLYPYYYPLVITTTGNDTEVIDWLTKMMLMMMTMMVTMMMIDGRWSRRLKDSNHAEIWNLKSKSPSHRGSGNHFKVESLYDDHLGFINYGGIITPLSPIGGFVFLWYLRLTGRPGYLPGYLPSASHPVAL